MLAGLAPVWPLMVAAGAVAVAVVGRLMEAGAAGPALLAMLLATVAKLALLPRIDLRTRRPASLIPMAIAGGVALAVPPLLTQPAMPLQTLLVALAVTGLGAARRVGWLVMEAAVAAAAVAGEPASMWLSAALSVTVLLWRRPEPLTGLLVMGLGLALHPSRAGGATMLAGAWLAAGIWPLGRWTYGLAARRFGSVALAVAQAGALAGAAYGLVAWPAGAMPLEWVGAVGVGVAGTAMAVARTPVRRLTADAAVQAALVAVAVASGATAIGAIHLLLRAPLLAMPATNAALRWARAGLPPFGTFWTTLAIVIAAGDAQPWLLALLLPGVLAYVAATWRAPAGVRAVPAWLGWLAMAPAAIAGAVWTVGLAPTVAGWLR